MAKVNMEDIKKDTVNSEEIEKLETSEQVETNKQSEELIDNAVEKAEDTSEIAQDVKTETKKETKHGDKVIVRYIGGGIWKDSKGALWASTNKSDSILGERQYDTNEYEKREDIKFMVKYGTMIETYVK